MSRSQPSARGSIIRRAIPAAHQPSSSSVACKFHTLFVLRPWLSFTSTLNGPTLQGVFPVDDEDQPPRRAPRLPRCPDCKITMFAPHRGKFVTIYVCPICGVTLTEPPREPPALA